MKTYTKIFAALALGTCTIGGIKAQNVAPFQNGDRVTFLGNSITDGGHYHSYIWLYYMTHFPKMKLTLYNVGVGGDRVDQMSDRFEPEILPKNPTVLVLTWGMNDTGYGDWLKPNAAELGKNAVDLAETRFAAFEPKLKAASNIKKIFIGGSPYDETTTSNMQNKWPGKAAALKQLIDFQSADAKKNGWGFVDFYDPMTAINLREQKLDPAFSLTPNDRVHPDNDGHMVMAYLFLKTQGLANKVVADVAIDAPAGKVSKSVNCAVSNVTALPNGTSFDYLANSLPYPLDTLTRGWMQKKTQAGAAKLVPFMEEFNTEKLLVKGLKAGNYQLVIDGDAICNYTAQQLANGVNLAEQMNTPQYQQAIQLREMNEERWEIERRFRMYAYVEFNLMNKKGLLYADNRAAMDTLKKAAVKDVFMNGNKETYSKAQFKSIRDAWQKEMNVLVDEIYANNKPLKRHIEIKLLN